MKRAIAQLRYGLPDGTGIDVMRMTNREARDHALRSLDDRLSTEHMQDDQKEQVSKTVRKNPTIARRVLVTETDAYRNAWMKMVSQPHPMLEDEERAAINRWYEFRAASENTTTAGGFGVPVFIDPSIIMTAQERQPVPADRQAGRDQHQHLEGCHLGRCLLVVRHGSRGRQ